jgi:hypothetical protein
LTETAQLLKLRERGSSAKKRQARSSALELGHISSDEEDNCGQFARAGSLVGGTTSILVASSSSDMECITLKRIFEVSLKLISFDCIHDAAEKILVLFIKLYKSQVKITKSLSLESCKALPQMYRVLAEHTANKVHPRLQDYIAAVSV